MTEEDKELLLKDICARLPYDVKCKIEMWIGCDVCTIYNINSIGYVEIVEDSDTNGVSIERIKTYLFPLSSMTEEQLVELKEFTDLRYEHNTLELVEWDNNYKTLEFWLEEIPSYNVIKVFDWLNKNHFDYRGLIEKGLSIDATNKNIY